MGARACVCASRDGGRGGARDGAVRSALPPARPPPARSLPTGPLRALDSVDVEFESATVRSLSAFSDRELALFERLFSRIVIA